MPPRWDIFCKLIDNYGDVGVTWRLARQLATEFGLDVRLWVDDLGAFCRICPEGNAHLDVQRHSGVTIQRWPAQWQVAAAADVVIEAFACELPSQYIKAMCEREQAPLWLNLEYLSAEQWVEGCHGLPSMQANKLAKYFFFPGFSAQTGGLLRESDLLERRKDFQYSPARKIAFLQDIGVELAENCQLMSLFCYENSSLSTWLDALATGAQAYHVLVPEGRIIPDLVAYLCEPDVQTDRVYCRGALRVQVLPFLSQEDYDYLLWACDFNIVRGEDSFVRAQWAGRPFIWHIYPQDEGVHMMKLEAFLQRYCSGLTPELRASVSECWQAWNQAQKCPPSWLTVLGAASVLTGHTERWCHEQAGIENLAYSLVQFQQNWL